MKRIISHALAAWKQQQNRKPLMLKGARQVGKTWSVKEFGLTQYKHNGHRFHYVDFQASDRIHSIFEESQQPKKIIALLQFHLNTHIDIFHDLLIFDEIQECPKAISSLKYFQQDLPSLDVIAAESHVGLVSSKESFPVGKINVLHMYPLNFGEFVQALDEHAYKYLADHPFTSPIPAIVHERLLQLFQLYSVVGGLPEAVGAYKDYWQQDQRKSILAARSIQHDLITGYRADFAKHSGSIHAMHINSVFDAVPAQLSQAYDDEVKKFRFKGVIPGKRGLSELTGPLTWLTTTKLCIKSLISNRALHPIASSCTQNRFKLFLFDVGILNAMLQLSPDALMSDKLGPYKGFLLENYVAQELYAQTHQDLISWQEGTAEIEFLLSSGSQIIPIEVKSAARSRRSKSLDSFISRYAPPTAVKLSRQNAGIHRERAIWTLPIYATYRLTTLLQTAVHNPIS